jgi:cytochrome c556
MPKTLTALIIVGVVTAVVGVTAVQDSKRETATVKEVMQTMTIPASDAIFSAASDKPKDAEGWLELRKNTVMLRESGELLMTGARAKDKAAWMDMARALVTEAQATLKAIDAKDGDALAQAGDDVYATCDTCHTKYLPQ